MGGAVFPRQGIRASRREALTEVWRFHERVVADAEVTEARIIGEDTRTFGRAVEVREGESGQVAETAELRGSLRERIVPQSDRSDARELRRRGSMTSGGPVRLIYGTIDFGHFRP